MDTQWKSGLFNEKVDCFTEKVDHFSQGEGSSKSKESLLGTGLNT